MEKEFYRPFEKEGPNIASCDDLLLFARHHSDELIERAPLYLAEGLEGWNDERACSVYRLMDQIPLFHKLPDGRKVLDYQREIGQWIFTPSRAMNEDRIIFEARCSEPMLSEALALAIADTRADVEFLRALKEENHGACVFRINKVFNRHK